MKLAKAICTCVVVVGVCVTLAPASRADAPTSEEPGLLFAAPFPGSESSQAGGFLLARETTVLMQRGASLARADESMAVLGVVSHTKFLRQLLAWAGNAFAGVWFEAPTAQLHVAVTSHTSKQATELLATRAGVAGNVTVTLVRSTWAQLLAVQRWWDRELAPLFKQEKVETTLDVRRNAVVVILGSSVRVPEQIAIKRAAAAAAVKVLVTVSHEPRLGLTKEARETECNLFVRRRAYCNKPITPGVRIESEKLVWECTAGPLVMPRNDKNRTYLLTAGHCLQKAVRTRRAEVRPKWYAFNKAGERAEIGRTTEYYNNATADIGAIRVNTPGKWALEGNPAVYAVTAEWAKREEKSFPVKGQEGPPMVGAPNCTEGQASGAVCGTIKAYPVTAGGTAGLVEWEPTAGNTTVGDSGAPVIKETKGEYLVEGVHSGKRGAFPVYEPIETALAELTRLKPELVTTANEVRPKESGEEKVANEKFEKEEKEEAEGKFKETKAEEEAAENELTEEKEAAEKEGDPLLSPAPTFKVPLTSTATSGVSTLESGEEKIECKEDTTSAEFTSLREGVISIDMHGCKAAGIGCKSSGDAAETILVEGRLALVDLEKAKLALGADVAIGEVRVECSSLITVLVRGSIIGEITGVESGKGTKSAAVAYKQEKGKQAIKECHLTKVFCEGVTFSLEASVNSGAFKEAGFGSEEKVTLGTEATFDF
jgi:hypothetical protein